MALRGHLQGSITFIILDPFDDCVIGFDAIDGKWEGGQGCFAGTKICGWIPG